MLAIFDFILLTWFFWPLAILFPLGAYFSLRDSVKKEESPILPGFLIALAGTILAYRYPWFREIVTSWKSIAWLVGSYVTAGFVLALYKWFVILWDFRKTDFKAHVDDAKLGLKNNPRASFLDESHYESDRVLSLLRRSTSLDKFNIQYNDDATYSFYPNWKQYPIGSWWVYWPFFLFEIPFDVLTRLITNLFNWFRYLFNGIARKFAVKVQA